MSFSKWMNCNLADLAMLILEWIKIELSHFHGIQNYDGPVPLGSSWYCLSNPINTALHTVPCGILNVCGLSGVYKKRWNEVGRRIQKIKMAAKFQVYFLVDDVIMFNHVHDWFDSFNQLICQTRFEINLRDFYMDPTQMKFAEITIFKNLRRL